MNKIPEELQDAYDAAVAVLTQEQVDDIWAYIKFVVGQDRGSIPPE